MKRIRKEWIAVAGALLVALAALVVVLLPEREHVPRFRFLGNHVPEVRHADPSRGPRTVYLYEFTGDFDSLAEAATQELTAEGFALVLDTVMVHGQKWKVKQYAKADEGVVVGMRGAYDEVRLDIAPEPNTERLQVGVLVYKPPLWQRLISRFRATVGF